MQELMTVQEAADYLRITKKTIYRLIESGELPATRVGRQFRFGKAAIDQWLANQSVTRKTRIIIIDDDEMIGALFKDTLEELGHTVVVVRSGQEGLEWIKRQAFDLVFLDLKMPTMDGAEVFRQLKSIRPALPVIIVTGYPEGELMARALSYGPFAVMNKPFEESHIIMAINNFVKSPSNRVI